MASTFFSWLLLVAVMLCVGCAADRPGPPIDHISLANKLDSQWPGQVPRVELADHHYELVPFSRVVRAALDAKRPYRREVWDCDDEVASALHRLRVQHQHDHVLPPAVGRLRGFIHDGQRNVHDVVWCLDVETGRVRLYDASFLLEPALGSLKPILLSDF